VYSPLPVETPAVDCYVEAHNTTLVAFRNPVDGISGQVADDGDFVHEDAPYPDMTTGAQRDAVPPPGVQLLAYLCASSYASMMYLLTRPLALTSMP
jgi:hypothetical protein